MASAAPVPTRRRNPDSGIRPRGYWLVKHGDSARGQQSHLYATWLNIKQWFNNPNNPSYHRYGGDGLKLCDEWQDFEGFKKWALSAGYQEGWRLKLIEHDRGFVPDNCIWEDHGSGYGPRSKPPKPSSDKRRILPGERHGSLVIIERDPASPNRYPRYVIQCDCGRRYMALGSSFRISVKCRVCCDKSKPKKYGDRSSKKMPLYRSWVNMRLRCYSFGDPKYKQWADKGITVCPEWEKDFAEFQRWSLANGYREGLSLDRLDVDGNYEPSNCEWVTRSENSKRARTTYVSIRRDEYERLKKLAGIE